MRQRIINDHEKFINKTISRLKEEGKLDPNNISDGYHYIGELYEHRINLFIALCEMILKYYDAADIRNDGPMVWKSERHSDGSMIEGWFIMGIGTEEGDQITYHLPISKWSDCSPNPSVPPC